MAFASGSYRSYSSKRLRSVFLVSAVFCGTAYIFQAFGLAQDSTAAKRASDTAATAQSKATEVDYKKITDAEWKKRLTKTQFMVTRKHDTERAFSGKYHDYKKDGVYTCVCCNLPLFDSKTKFDSGTGWPSFYQPLKETVIGKSEDRKLGYPRVEVHCSRCDAHLGHVFDDAPQTPTGLRYCMNSRH